MSLQQIDLNIRRAPPPVPQPPAAVQVRPGTSKVDEAVWRAVAGIGADIAGVKSYVYYFLQGHLEQLDASSLANNHNFYLIQPMVHCQVISVDLHFDPVSDQPFVKFALQPTGKLPICANGSAGGSRGGGGGGSDENDFFSVAKVLTLSDANNGGGFSVPKFCADKIFPRLDYGKDPPVQNLFLTDTHERNFNEPWEFRHIYRGTPRRHLLTTGWSKFVNAKMLIAGDSVVFMRRKSTNELFIGVRRSRKFSGSGEGYGGKEVVKEIEKAVRGIAFEVMYYPKIGVPNFVVLAEKVNQSLRMRRWIAGMRVRMAVETDDSARMTSIQGVVTAAEPPASGRWHGSPWCMLQVKWDDPEISSKKVSPWEVEYIPLAPVFDPGFRASKRLRLVNEYGMRTTTDVPVNDPSHSSPSDFSLSSPPDFSLSSPSIPVIEFSHLPSTSAILNYSPFPAGMQGARLGETATNGFASTSENVDEEEELIGVSTALTLGTSHSAAGPPSDVQPSSPFKLFGVMITKPASENGDEGGSDQNGVVSETPVSIG